MGGLTLPHSALKPCSYSGCSNLVQHGRCELHPMPNLYRDAEVQRLYGRRWQARRRVFLAEHPWCEECLRANIYTPATDVHHLVRHGGDVELFNSSPLEALCKACHSKKTLEEVGHGKGYQNV